MLINVPVSQIFALNRWFPITFTHNFAELCQMLDYIWFRMHIRDICVRCFDLFAFLATPCYRHETKVHLLKQIVREMHHVETGHNT